jgi:hypothetical protein
MGGAAINKCKSNKVNVYIQWLVNRFGDDRLRGMETETVRGREGRIDENGGVGGSCREVYIWL